MATLYLTHEVVETVDYYNLDDVPSAEEIISTGNLDCSMEVDAVCDGKTPTEWSYDDSGFSEGSSSPAAALMIDSSSPPPHFYQPVALISGPSSLQSLLSEYCHHRTQKEYLNYGDSKVPSFDEMNFIFGRFSPQQIHLMSQTTLWRLHCVHGRKLRKFIWKRLGLPKPVVRDRKHSKVCKEGSIAGRQKAMKAASTVSSEDNYPTVEIPRTSPKKQVAVHEFCIDVLQDEFYSQTRQLLKWIDRKQHIFKICDSNGLAKLWTKVKDNFVDSPENFGRAIRFSRFKSSYFKEMVPQPKKSRQFTPAALEDYEKKRAAFQRECDRMENGAQS